MRKFEYKKNIKEKSISNEDKEKTNKFYFLYENVYG